MLDCIFYANAELTKVEVLLKNIGQDYPISGITNFCKSQSSYNRLSVYLDYMADSVELIKTYLGEVSRLDEKSGELC